jgi:hypothetical protein
MCNCFVTNMGKVIPQSRMALLVMGVMAEPPTLFFRSIHPGAHVETTF